MKTIDKIKEEHKVPEALKQQVKEFGRINREIIKALKEEPRTIPQVAEITGMDKHLVTYHLMTLLKYGKLETGDIDDMDEYYYYKLKS
jgi:predicted transcriptional regulator